MADNKELSSLPNDGGQPGIDNDLGAGSGDTITCERRWTAAAAESGRLANSPQNNNDDRDSDIERLEAKLDALLLALDVDPDSVGGDD
jgi:hypothetical protein